MWWIISLWLIYAAMNYLLSKECQKWCLQMMISPYYNIRFNKKLYWFWTWLLGFFCFISVFTLRQNATWFPIHCQKFPWRSVLVLVWFYSVTIVHLFCCFAFDKSVGFQCIADTTKMQSNIPWHCIEYSTVRTDSKNDYPLLVQIRTIGR